MRILRIYERKRKREREIAGISREKRNRILQLWFECGKATPLSKRFCFILCCPIRMNEIDGSMDGERVYKRFASSVSKWLLFVSCRWKNFVNNHARVFGLKRSRAKRFLSGNGEYIVMRGQYSAEIAIQNDRRIWTIFGISLR